MVLEGQFVQDFRSGQIWRTKTIGDGAAAKRELEPVTLQQIEDAKQPIYQLSSDGMTLVTIENGRAAYTIRDLSKQNAGTTSPLSRTRERGRRRDTVAVRVGGTTTLADGRSRPHRTRPCRPPHPL